MEYVLVHKNNVEFGPIGWNTRIFNTVLNDELGINYTVTIGQESADPLIIDADTKIMPVTRQYPTSGGGVTQDLIGPIWNLSGSVAIAGYQFADKTLESARRGIKAEIANARWGKQNTVISVDLNGTSVLVATDKATKDTLVSALADGLTSRSWKFVDQFVTVDNTGLQTVITAIAQHVQDQFDWEAGQCSQVDACATLADIASYYAAFQESLKPVVETPPEV